MVLQRSSVSKLPASRPPPTERARDTTTQGMPPNAGLMAETMRVQLSNLQSSRPVTQECPPEHTRVAHLRLQQRSSGRRCDWFGSCVWQDRALPILGSTTMIVYLCFYQRIAYYLTVAYYLNVSHNPQASDRFAGNHGVMFFEVSVPLGRSPLRHHCA